MFSVFDSDMSMGFQWSSLLLQVNLGVGLALLAAAFAATSSSELAQQQKGDRWQAASRAVGAATGSVPLLAVYALVQAEQHFDLLTSVGFMVSTLAVVLGVLVVFFAAVSDLEIPNVDSKTGEISCAIVDSEGQHAGRYSAAARVVSLLRVCGSALLLFAALPVGLPLQCSSALVRLALGVHCAAAGLRALGVSAPGLLLDLEECLVSLAPVLGGLAFLDHIAWDSGFPLPFFMNAFVYFAVACLMQVVCVCVTCGTTKDPNRAEFDFCTFLKSAQGEDGFSTSALWLQCRLLGQVLYATMVLSIVQVLFGTFSVQAGIGELTITWREGPLFANAVKLAVMWVGVHFIEFQFPARPLSSASEVDEAKSSLLGAIDHLKAIVAPTFTLMLAMVVSHKRNASSIDSLDEASIVNTVLGFASMGNLKYGFMLAGLGVGLQVLSLGAFTIWHYSDKQAATPSFDATGCIQWDAQGAFASKVVTFLRNDTRLFLQVGLLLGWISLGVSTWIVIGLPVGVLVLTTLPAAARHGITQVITACVCAAGGIAGNAFGCVQSHMERRRQSTEAADAQKAAQYARQLEAEVEEPKGKASAEKAAGKAKAQKDPDAWKAAGSKKKKAR